MKLLQKWLVPGLLLGSFTLSLPTLAEPTLGVPNCMEADVPRERTCCLYPDLCEGMGFQQPEPGALSVVSAQVPTIPEIVTRPVSSMAQSNLVRPDCENPGSIKERGCCTVPARCEHFGFRQPPDRTPDCENPQSENEATCCGTPSDCTMFGFRRPALAPDVQTVDCAIPQEGAAYLCCEFPAKCEFLRLKHL